MFDLLYADNVALNNGNSIMNFLPMILLLLVFYFFLIRPQKKKFNEHQKMISNLKIGDKVLTNSGIYGVIKSFKEDTKDAVYISISDNTTILILKDSIIKII